MTRSPFSIARWAKRVNNWLVTKPDLVRPFVALYHTVSGLRLPDLPCFMQWILVAVVHFAPTALMPQLCHKKPAIVPVLVTLIAAALLATLLSLLLTVVLVVVTAAVIIYRRRFLGIQKQQIECNVCSKSG